MTGTNLVVEGVAYFDDALPGDHAPYIEADGTVVAIPLVEYPAATVSNDIYRRINGGPWVLIAEGVPAQGTVVDYTSAASGVSEYRAVAVSALPSSASSGILTLEIPRDGTSSLWLSRGEDFSVVGRAHRNHDITQSVGPAEQAVQYYAGRTLPVGLESAQLAETFTASWDIFPDAITTDTPDQSLAWWQQWARLGGPVLVRDAESGARFVGTCSGLSAARGQVGIYRLSVSLTKTRDAP